MWQPVMRSQVVGGLRLRGLLRSITAVRRLWPASRLAYHVP